MTACLLGGGNAAKAASLPPWKSDTNESATIGQTRQVFANCNASVVGDGERVGCMLSANDIAMRYVLVVLEGRTTSGNAECATRTARSCKMQKADACPWSAQGQMLQLRDVRDDERRNRVTQ